jgi:UDP-N-acetylglucosamine 2-epimerase (non-hydrolysing)
MRGAVATSFGVSAGRLRIASVVGTRPNIMKIAPIAHAVAWRADEFEHVLVHTGQHYDRAMSQVFLEEFALEEPRYQLGVGSGSHARQIGRCVERLERPLREVDPHVVLVAGDVNSTVAAALTAVKLGLTVAHVEAGLRSFDRTMPEEINRVVTDSLSSIHFIHSPEARTNLLAEGCHPESVHDVGNTMIDALVTMRERIAACQVRDELGVDEGGYIVVTLHRPALVDSPLLEDALEALAELSETFPVVFPVHPRTRAAIVQLTPRIAPSRLLLLDPIGYVEFLSLVTTARAVLTDSGGIQEETTFLGVPCFTLRDNTERPITVEQGTNMLLGLSPRRIVEIPALLKAQADEPRSRPPLWDGNASQRIIGVLRKLRDVPSMQSLNRRVGSLL